MKEIVFIKFGGSLITDKDIPFTPRPAILNQVSLEFKSIQAAYPDTSFILGHGSGSFGHNVAKKYQTRTGVKTAADWKGFVAVWSAARRLNTLFLEAFLKNDVPCMAFPPSSILTAHNGKASAAHLLSLQAALQHGIIPIVYGDVVFDETRGGTILSTEDIFFYLTQHFCVQRILLCGIEPAIYADFPNNQEPILKITPDTFPVLKQKIGHSASPDVTGGMIEKVRLMVDLIRIQPHLKIHIFSAAEPGNIQKILGDEPIGTRLEREE